MIPFSKVLSKGLQSALARTPIENGKIRFATDTGRLFIDENNVRIEITDFCKDYTEEGIKSIISPLPKIYISSDTNKMMFYSADRAEWIYLSGKLADMATNASTAQYAVKAKDADNATNASTASYAVNSSTAYISSLATSAAYSNNASTADYAKNTSTAETAKNASTSIIAISDPNGNGFLSNYAPLQSPLFTGIPSTPTPVESSCDTQIANTEFVINAIKTAISSITGIDFKILSKDESLPETGTKGTFYLVPITGGSDNNLYDEYVWIEATSKYEHIGSSSFDVSGCLTGFSMGGTGNAITGVSTSEDGTKLVFEKGISFLTQHPSVTVNGASTAEFIPTAGESFKTIDSVVLDEYGHLKSYILKTVQLPNSVSTAQYAVKAKDADNATNASTASYAQNAPIFKGATTESNGVAGLVPMPTTAQRGYVLRGDGTWGNASYSYNGVVVGSTTPGVGDVGLLWIDTGNNGIMKYRTSTQSTVWTPVPSVWS